MARRLVAAAMVVAGPGFIGLGCGDDDAAATGRVLRSSMTEPDVIDPAGANVFDGMTVAQLVFDTLVSVDSVTSNLKAAVAERWAANGDCTVWTFQLRSDSRFSTGEPVTAASFIAGMTRAADDAARSKVAYHMAGIAGFDALHGTDDAPGTSEVFSGLSAPDPHTLVVTLSQPDCEFDKKTAQPVMSPVPGDAGPARNPTFNDRPIGNGPFRLAEPWQHDRRIRLVRNDHHPGPRPFVEEIEFAIFKDVDSGYRAFRSGDLDLVPIAPSSIADARQRYPKGVIEHPGTTVQYLTVSTATPPLDDVRLRRAISLAIDRAAIARDVLHNSGVPATGLVPPAFPDVHQPGVCDACVHDVAAARAAAAAAGVRPGTTVDLIYEPGDGYDELVQAIAAAVHDATGVRLNLVPLDMEAEGNDRLASPGFSGLGFSGWGADYPTADNFLYPILSTDALPPGDNQSQYSNSDFDELISTARATRDDRIRTEAYRAAERLAIGRDLALIPLFVQKSLYVYDATRWSGVDMDFFDMPTYGTITAVRTPGRGR